MGLFNYNSPGPGISKESLKKTGSKLFFDLLGRKFWTIIGINMLMYLFFIPLMLFPFVLKIPNDAVSYAAMALIMLVFLLTFGPAMAGMTKLMRCFLIEKHCFVMRDFFGAFKQNYKKAVLIGILDCVALVSAIGSIYVYPLLAIQYGTKLMYVFMVISLSIALVFLLMNFYIYLMLVATNLSLKNLFKNSFALAFVDLKKNALTFGIIVLFMGLMYLMFCFLPTVFLMVVPFFPFAMVWFIVCFNSYPTIQKYVINPYYTSIGQVNPELIDDTEESDEESLCVDMGGKEKPVEKPKKNKKKIIS